jgi:hypothetical protein
LHSGDVSAAADAQLSTDSKRPGWTPPLGAPRLSNTIAVPPPHSFCATGRAQPVYCRDFAETGSVWWLSSFCTKTKSLET